MPFCSDFTARLLQHPIICRLREMLQVPPGPELLFVQRIKHNPCPEDTEKAESGVNSISSLGPHRGSSQICSMRLSPSFTQLFLPKFPLAFQLFPFHVKQHSPWLYLEVFGCPTSHQAGKSMMAQGMESQACKGSPQHSGGFWGATSQPGKQLWHGTPCSACAGWPLTPPTCTTVKFSCIKDYLLCRWNHS